MAKMFQSFYLKNIDNEKTYNIITCFDALLVLCGSEPEDAGVSL